MLLRYLWPLGERFWQQQRRKHEELLKEARLQGRNDLKYRDPYCDCRDCMYERDQKIRHGELEKVECNKGINGFANGVPGCGCVEYQPVRLKRHRDLRMGQWLRGASYNPKTISECPCHSCHKNSWWTAGREVADFWEDRASQATLALPMGPRLSKAALQTPHTRKLQLPETAILQYLRKQQPK